MNWLTSLVGSRGLTSNASFKQESPPLLVTKELEKALEDCQKTVEQISKDCRAKNRKFRDVEFDLENDKDRCLHGLKSPRYNPSDVQRVTQIFENPRFFVDGADSNDIVQGELEDCWFLSALATMSTAPHLIEKFCVARDEQVGVYGFIFFRDSAWSTVIIDDMLFTSIPKFDELNLSEKKLYHNDRDTYNKSARKNGKGLSFARSGTHGETWVPLIEKAFAKLHGSYNALDYGVSCEAVEDLTGQDIFDIDRFWNEELRKANKDCLFGCGFQALDTRRSGSIVPLTVNGLIGGHSYSVLRAVECKGKRFVVIRNPWGESEWTGPWSDGSKEWTKEWLEVLPELGHVFGDDGQFVMEYSDFLACWEEIERTRLFDPSWIMSSQWLRVPARPLPSAWGYGDVSFTISLPQPSFTIIVLSELDDRYFRSISGRFEWSFDFVLFKKGSREPLGDSSPGGFHTRGVNLEINLEAGDYVIHVRLDRRLSIEPPFTGSVYDRKLSRVMTERAKSQSKAINFQTREQARNLPIPMEILAGRDLAELDQKPPSLPRTAFANLDSASVHGEFNARVEVLNTTSTVTFTAESLSRSNTIQSPGADYSPARSPVPVGRERTLSFSTNASGSSFRGGVGLPTVNSGHNEWDSHNIYRQEPSDDESQSEAEPRVRPISPNVEATLNTHGSGLALLQSPGRQSQHVWEDENTVFLGLRVYTNKEAPATVGSQLRSGGDDRYRDLVTGNI